MQPKKLLVVVVTAAMVLWMGNRVYRAQAKLVTLEVRNMEVRRVVSKLEWQTWERIIASPDLSGKVTLNVRDVPLDEVLNIVSLQTDSRWTKLYPIYSNRKALAAFKQVLRGKLAPMGSGWQSLQRLGAWQQNNLAGFANVLRAQNNLVSAQFLHKDINFAAFALSRFSKAEVVPEDKIPGTIFLKLEQVPFEKAVAKVAKQVHRKWDRIYTLRASNAFKVVRPTLVKTGDPAQTGTTNQTNTVADAPVKAKADDKNPPTQDQALEAFLATLSPPERAMVETELKGANPSDPAAVAQRQQMQAAAMQAAQADIERRIQNRLKNGTVDQRIAHDRQQLGKPRTGP